MSPTHLCRGAAALLLFASMTLGAAEAKAANGDARAAVAKLVGVAAAGAGIDPRFAAVNRAVAAGKDALPWLIGALGHDTPAVREDAARALGRLGSEKAFQPLLACLKDPEESVRAAAAEALGMLGDRRATAPLLNLLAKGDESERRGAAVGLGSLRTPKAIPALERQCAAQSWEERWRAAIALGKIGRQTAAATVSRLTRDDNPVVAAAADWALGTIAGRPYFQRFEKNLSGSDSGVVWASAWALGVIGSPRAVAELKTAAAGQNETARAAARMVLLWLGDSPVATGESAAGKDREPAAGGSAFLDLEGRWFDRYGALELQLTRPVPVRVGDKAVESAAGPLLLARFESGELLLVTPGNRPGPAAAGQTLRSRDKGKTWTARATLVRRPAAFARLVDGTVLVYDQYAFATTAGDFVRQICISRDGGRTFGPLQSARLDPGADWPTELLPAPVRQAYRFGSIRLNGRGFSAFRGRVIEKANDVLLACGIFPGEAGAAAGFACFRSGDRGLSWERIGAFRQAAQSPAMLRIGADHLLCIAAKGARERLARFESMDGGKTWQETRPLAAAGSSPALCATSSGMPVCAFVAPDGLMVMFNVNGRGRNWTDRILVDAAPGPTATVALTEIRPGVILLVWTRAAKAESADRVTLWSARVHVTGSKNGR